MKALAAPSLAWFSKLTPMTWFAVLFMLTSVLALSLPPDPHSLEHLHLDTTGYHIAILALLIPYILCWYASFYVFAKLTEYTRYLQNSHEGKAYDKITKGVGVLAFGLIIPTLISLLLSQVTIHHGSAAPAVKIINDYIGIIFPLLAFLFISSGSRMLVTSMKVRPKFGGVHIFAVIFIILSVSYTFLVSHNYYRYHNPYHLNLIVLMLTFIAPYLYLWFIGLLSAYEFKLYSINVKGKLYKRGLSLFSSGIGITICGSILSQFIQSSFGARESSVGLLVLLNYFFLLIIAGGLAMMAVGANKLKKIEEI